MFQIVDISTTFAETFIAHNIFMQRDIGFNAFYQQFVQCVTHAGDSNITET